MLFRSEQTLKKENRYEGSSRRSGMLLLLGPLVFLALVLTSWPSIASYLHLLPNPKFGIYNPLVEGFVSPKLNSQQPYLTLPTTLAGKQERTLPLSISSKESKPTVKKSLISKSTR